MRRFVIVLGVLALAAGGLCAAGVWWSRDAQRAEYPAPPFEAQGAGGPILFMEREFPRTGTPAEKKAWRDEEKARERYLSEQGAMRRATDKEREAVKAVFAEQYVRARELAQETLSETPDSIPATFVMAEIQYKGERNLPLALYQIRQLRHRLEDLGQANPADADGREWYIRVLDLEADVLNYMDRRVEELAALDCLDKVYRPRPWRRMFALLKLGRLDEVEEIVDRVEKQGGWPLKALNMRCMIAEAHRDRAGCYRAGKDMVAKVPTSAVLWNNFGLSCLEDFRFTEAEDVFVRAATHKNQDFNNSSYFALSHLYLQQARLAEAWAAVRKGQEQRAQRPAHTREQDQATVNHALAAVLVVLGHPEAERFARLAEADPNRLGSNTAKARDQQFTNGLLLWAVLRSRGERLREDQALNSLGARLMPDGTREGLTLEEWTLERRLVKVLAEDQVLSDVFRPYLPGAPGDGPWCSGLVLEFLPPGVASEAIRQARDLEQHPSVVPYFDALSAHLALRKGQPRQALELAERALEKLPLQAERLLRGRAAAIAAEAARQLGERETCLRMSALALRDFPQAFRLHGFTIPVRIDHDGSPLAQRLAEHLRGSCRFRSDNGGFIIRVTSNGGSLVVRMERGPGDLHVEVKNEIKGAESEVVASAFRHFHERLTSPWLDLKPVDVNTMASTPVKKGP